MKFDLKDIITSVLILLLGVALGYQSYHKYRLKRSNEAIERKYYECINAPKQIDTVHDTIIIRATSTYKPKPLVKKNEMEEVEDTSIIISKVCEQWYEDTYKGEGIKVHWKAHIVDCIIDEMSFPEVFCPKDIITIKSKVDTCIDKRPEYKPKNHIGMSIGLLGNNINKFPNIETDFWWTIKDKWGIYGGGEYNVYHNEFYARLGVKVFFK